MVIWALFGCLPLVRQPTRFADSSHHGGLPLPGLLLHSLLFPPSVLVSLLLPLLSSPSSHSQVCQLLGIQVVSPWLPLPTCCSRSSSSVVVACLLPEAAAHGWVLPTTCLPFSFSPVTSRDAWALGLCSGLFYQPLCFDVHCTFFLRDHVERMARSTWHLPWTGGGFCWLLV